MFTNTLSQFIICSVIVNTYTVHAVEVDQVASHSHIRESQVLWASFSKPSWFSVFIDLVDLFLLGALATLLKRLTNMVTC